MQPLLRNLYGIQRCVIGARSLPCQVPRSFYSIPNGGLSELESDLLSSWRGMTLNVFQYPTSVAKHNENGFHAYREFSASLSRITLPTTRGNSFCIRQMATVSQPVKAAIEDESVASTDTVQPQRIKFKRLDKTARHIMNIVDKEEVEKVKGGRDIPDIKPGYIVQLKVEVPENKRRVSILKGIVIARRNAGLQTTFRLRRMVAGVGVESVFPLLVKILNGWLASLVHSTVAIGVWVAFTTNIMNVRNAANACWWVCSKCLGSMFNPLWSSNLWMPFHFIC